MKKGSVIGNVAQDLGLDLKRLRSGRARIVTGENIQYTELKTDKGILVVKERIDREQLCGDETPCSFSFEVILENPIELHRDQNDNPPQVLYPIQTGGSLVAEMVPRSADVGYLVTKVVAVDVDSGQNAWLSYKLQKATDRALFEVGLQNGEIRTIRQVTDKDAVKQRLTVIVEDNGQPSRSATVIVNVVVADSFPEVLSEFTDFTQDKEYNDNLTFYLVLALAVVSFLFITCLVVIISVKIYRWRQSRIMFHSNLPVIPYYPPRYSDTLGTGTLQHVYNYEVCRTTDSRKSDCKFGGAGSQNVLIMDPSSTGTMQRIQSEKSILDEPDSPLESIFSYFYFCNGVWNLSTLAMQEMKKGSLIGNVAQDLGLDLRRLRSGRARIVTGENIQYTELKTDKGILVVKERIDREQLCRDVTPCSFSLEKYAEMVLQKPLDRETNPNLSLKLIAVDGGTPQRSAQDGGSPPLSSNVTVKILIQDQNDNPPQVLYPVQTGGSLVAEMVPRAADVGYLVTKVVAVDVDSGQNAWLSYKLQKATDRALFEVGLQNGEIRTIRQVTDKDAVKQRLTVIVEDNGQPSRSATVIVNVVVADSFPEVLSEFTDFTQDKEYNDNLTFYLVLALAVVSFLFITCLVVIISVKIYRWRQSRIMFHSNLPVIPYYPPRYSDTLGTGTLQHVYNYEVCRTTDSRKSDCKFGGAGSQNVLIMDPSSTGTMQRIQSEKSILDEPDSPLEEMKKGSVIGNVAQDLGLDLKRLRSGRARIVTGENIHYTELKTDKGILVVNERIDREELCGDETPCSFSFEDQNDNPPQVLYPVQTGGSLVAEMVPRSADVGYLVTKVVAVDVDSGQNAWLSYKLQKATDRALFEVGLQNGEIRTIRQVTDKDAVKQRLTVIVEDNGQPSRSATVIVNVVVADSFPEVLSEFTDFTQDKEYNDNLTFYLVLALAVVSFLFITCLVVIISVKIYRWRQSRIMCHSNLPVIPYYPPRYSDTLGTGTLQHVYNYEVCRTTDSRKSDCKSGGAGSQNVLIMDPSYTGTMQRIQSEKSILDEPYSLLERLRSGRARVVTGESIQYTELKTDKGTLVVNERIDREQLCAEVDYEKAKKYEIRIEATDQGALTDSSKVIVEVIDVNDNSPVLNVMSFTSPVSEDSPPGTTIGIINVKDLDSENNSPGISVLTVRAKDPDENQNSRISYILEDTQIGGSPVSEYISINAESGVIHAVRSFDYEQIKQLVVVIKAQDAGSPPLSSNVTVKILIQDQNDNPPQVLYPVQTGGSLVAEMVPRAADVGYLVSKVVAVDVDSGQNAWLSYKLQKATDRVLFGVGLQNGEIRTIRQVTDKDAVKQRLTVIVEDNGQPSRSATVIVNVVVSDSFPEVLSEFTDFTQDKEYNDNLTFYLVLALAVVSFLFITCLVVIISVNIYRWRQSRIMFHSNLPVIPYYPPRYSDTLGTGTLQHVYNYEVCRTTDSRKSDCKFGGAGSQNVLIMDPSSTGTMQRIQSEKSILDEPDSPLEVS
ncbi:hypothetical protein JOQ06_024114 [Pogonophryne albipinna]|uniref:Cadherin domain-containing protein n=1 Tax=Pogonophryne albipinna TaxID=1090488 RepID=A0AAD6BLH2_9TELE|nr:hypothetical protein JOQ06_024114 [Pogonophryne albipinna]